MKRFTMTARLAATCAVAVALLAAHTVVHAQSSLPAPWASADIGDVGLAGNSYQYDGDFFVSGAGADIWGTADAFQFAYAPLQGDGDVAVTVHGESDTNYFAKAGLMIRQTLDPSSPHVILDINPSGRVEFMTRSVYGGETTLLATSSVTVSATSNGSNFFYGPGEVKVRLARSGDQVTGKLSVDSGATWTVLGTATLGGSALAGVAVTSHDPTMLNHAYFTGSPSVTKVPAPWMSFDFGTVGLPGDAWYANRMFTVSGAGADIWGTSDAFHAVFQDIGGDFSVEARVLSEQNTNYFAKAGIMVRADQVVSSATAIVDVLPNGTVEFMSRGADGGEMAVVAYDSTTLPAWLKLVRTGDQVTAWIGTDPLAMRSLGTTTVALTPPGGLIEAGLVVTSHDTTQLNTAVFDNVSVAAPTGNLLVNGGFEQSTPPDTGPGWVSDSYRQVPAKSETNQPRSGMNNGACWATDYLDCGMYQDVRLPATGTYLLTFYANADRPGGIVGFRSQSGGSLGELSVGVHGFGSYGDPVWARFDGTAGQVIRVWMYSPATPGYLVIDDVSLVLVR